MLRRAWAGRTRSCANKKPEPRSDSAKNNKALGRFRGAVRHLLDQLDNAPAQLRIGNAHERLDQSEAIRGGQEVGHIGGRGCFAQAKLIAWRGRCALEEE